MRCTPIIAELINNYVVILQKSLRIIMCRRATLCFTGVRISINYFFIYCEYTLYFSILDTII